MWFVPTLPWPDMWKLGLACDLCLCAMLSISICGTLNLCIVFKYVNLSFHLASLMYRFRWC
jgi:hypothetical protein